MYEDSNMTLSMVIHHYTAMKNKLHNIKAKCTIIKQQTHNKNYRQLSSY